MKKSKIALSDISFDKREEDAVLGVMRSRWISMGEVCAKFEREFASYIGSSHCLAVTNGTAAMHLAFLVLGIGPQDEVIAPSLTFVATANAIRYTGARVVFADINSFDDLTISAEDIEKKITKRTKAICVVHYGGYPCDMEKINALAKKYRLYVVEDAAHGPGSYYKGNQIGAIGDIGCFSFFANKNLATAEGGMIATNCSDLAKRIRLLRSHGMTSLSWDRYKGRAYLYDVVKLGFNYRFDEIRAAIGRVQLKKLADNNKKRSLLAGHYVNLLRKDKGVHIPFLHCQEKVSHHIFPVLLSEGINRNKLIERLAKKGIQTSVHYTPIHRMSIYRNLCKYGLPFTEAVGERELTLPLHPCMRIKDVKRITEALRGSLINS